MSVTDLRGYIWTPNQVMSNSISGNTEFSIRVFINSSNNTKIECTEFAIANNIFKLTTADSDVINIYNFGTGSWCGNSGYPYGLNTETSQDVYISSIYFLDDGGALPYSTDSDIIAWFESNGTLTKNKKVNKVIVNGVASIDLTDDHITSPAAGWGTVFHKADGEIAMGSMDQVTLTPVATKGTVTNHSIEITPSVTPTEDGYVTANQSYYGSPVTVSASELVSGTISTITTSSTDVTNYKYASAPAGTAGTPTATKGSVSNHAISVTPSVTNTTGYITGSTKTGTAVTVAASELVSGTKNLTNTSSTDVTNYANAQVVDSNLTAGNIKKDVSILGVTGSYEGSGGGTMQSKSITLGSAAPSTTTPDSGYDGLSSVSYTVDSSVIKSTNIKSGATILGVSGDPMVVSTYVGSIGASASDILSGKAAYVNGNYVAGTGTGGGGTPRDEDDINITSNIVSLPSGQYDPSTVDKITWDGDTWGLETHKYSQYIAVKVSNQYVPWDDAGSLSGGTVKVGGTSYTIQGSWIDDGSGKYIVLNASGYWGPTAIFVSGNNVLINDEYYTKGTYFIKQNNSLYPTELTLFSGSLYYTQATKRISPENIITQYITFTATSANSSVTLTQSGTEYGTWKFKYSTDNTTWSDYTVGTSITLSAIGKYVSFAGIDNYNGYQNNTSYKKFSTTGGVKVSGKLSGLYGQSGDFAGPYAYYYLFYNNTKITSIRGLTAPACVIQTNALYGLFYGCTGIQEPLASLPATRVETYGYAYMYYNCTGLTSNTQLPATTLGSYAYAYMYRGCTNLETTVTSLPATSLPTYAYAYMYYGCSNLVTHCSLPATSLNTACYQYMFYNCDKLTTIASLPATTLAQYCYRYMYQNSALIKVSSSQTGDYQTQWRIPTSGTGTTATNFSTSMLAGTGGTFTSNPVVNTTYYTSNTVV